MRTVFFQQNIQSKLKICQGFKKNFRKKTFLKINEGKKHEIFFTPNIR